MTATILVLLICKWFRIVNYPSLSKETVRKIWPLPLLYLGNMLFGLGGTQELSLPMMTVLRRFSILMTMIGEFYVLKVNPEMKVQLSVYMMILGAIIAACNDLAFSLKVEQGADIELWYAPCYTVRQSTFQFMYTSKCYYL